MRVVDKMWVLTALGRVLTRGSPSTQGAALRPARPVPALSAAALQGATAGAPAAPYQVPRCDAFAPRRADNSRLVAVDLTHPVFERSGAAALALVGSTYLISTSGVSSESVGQLDLKCADGANPRTERQAARI